MTGEKNVENKMELRFPAISANEGFARICAAAFASQLDPTLEEIADIKTAISEAVTNAIVHAYEKKGGQVILRGKLDEKGVHFEIEDAGRGIPNLEEAMQPFYTTCSGEAWALPSCRLLWTSCMSSPSPAREPRFASIKK